MLNSIKSKSPPTTPRTQIINNETRSDSPNRNLRSSGYGLFLNDAQTESMKESPEKITPPRQFITNKKCPDVPDRNLRVRSSSIDYDLISSHAQIDQTEPSDESPEKITPPRQFIPNRECPDAPDRNLRVRSSSIDYNFILHESVSLQIQSDEEPLKARKIDFNSLS
jgi:hypothetical protein